MNNSENSKDKEISINNNYEKQCYEAYNNCVLTYKFSDGSKIAARILSTCMEQANDFCKQNEFKLK